MTEQHHVTVDGNEAAARIAFLANELIALYPVPPSAPMGELADTWAYGDKKNVWGTVPRVIQMQGEGGVAGVLHGALQTGALATTFTASQGLLLMIPDMYRIAGELSPAVIHVAARAVATHASSVYADHSDVMAVRQTGWAMLAVFMSIVTRTTDVAVPIVSAAIGSVAKFSMGDKAVPTNPPTKTTIAPRDITKALAMVNNQTFRGSCFISLF